MVYVGDFVFLIYNIINEIDVDFFIKIFKESLWIRNVVIWYVNKIVVRFLMLLVIDKKGIWIDWYIKMCDV